VTDSGKSVKDLVPYGELSALSDLERPQRRPAGETEQLFRI
jgi:hypothetical protein